MYMMLLFGFAPFYQWWATVLGVAGAYWLTVRNDKIGGFWRTLVRVSPFGAMYGLFMFWWVLHSIYVVPELAQQFAIWTIPGTGILLTNGIQKFDIPFILKKSNSEFLLYSFFGKDMESFPPPLN